MFVCDKEKHDNKGIPSNGDSRLNVIKISGKIKLALCFGYYFQPGYYTI